MEILLRPAAAKDLSGILEIVNHNILNSTAIYDYDPKTLADMETWLSDKEAAGWPVIVAVEGDAVVGYGSYGPFRFKQGYRFTIEHSVYVTQSHAGKGVGRLLLLELISRAKSGGYHCMIGGIDADNKGSIEFHKKFGFTETGVIKEAGFKFGRWLDLAFLQLILE